MTHDRCPACNGKRRKPTDHPMVFECRRCGAVCGGCTKGDSYAIVLPVMAADPVPAGRCRTYDLRVLGSDGVSRRHGWFDLETRRIVQVG